MKQAGKILGTCAVAFVLAFAVTAANLAADRGAAALRSAEAQAEIADGHPIVQATTARALPRMRRGVASAYGPGLWGNHVGCRPYPRLQRTTVGIAAKPSTARCGAVLQVCERRSGRCVSARVIDRGPYVAGRDLDLTEAMVRRFGVSGWRSWGVRTVHYRCVRSC